MTCICAVTMSAGFYGAQARRKCTPLVSYWVGGMGMEGHGSVKGGEWLTHGGVVVSWLEIPK